MIRLHCLQRWVLGAAVGGLISLPALSRAEDDTARFNGTWKASFLVNGQTATVISVHDEKGYRNYIVTPNGNQPFGDGTFTASNGKWTSSAPAPNDRGTYRFIDSSSVACTNSAGQKLLWRRTDAVEPAPSSPSVHPQPGEPKRKISPAFVPDPAVSPQVNAAFKALYEKDYKTAWAGLMAEAQKGDSAAEAGLGMMLFQRVNPPGTGFYAQCERWLVASANHGNVHGMYFLAQYYNEVGRTLSSGINPGHNDSVAPAQRAEAEKKYALARHWFERAAEKGDGYAMANLAIMLDAGAGGPRDPERAAELRARAAKLVDPNYKKRALENPTHQAMTLAWQAGHYADALKTAQEQAARGDASAEALLGKAYYEGVGVPQNYATALHWLRKAVDQKNPEGMFILGLMYEHGRGVQQDLPRALGLFDEAGNVGHRFAQMEAKGMRMQGEANRTAAMLNRENAACTVAGGITVSGGECLRGGATIDPYAPWENSGK